MNLTDLSKEIHSDNKKKGFWDGERNVGELLMQVVSELGEAMEALRKGQNNHCDNLSVMVSYYNDYKNSATENEWDNYKWQFEHCVKDTFEDEIADTIIRLLDLSGGLGIDIQRHVELKLAYNRLRPYKHGKKF